MERLSLTRIFAALVYQTIRGHHLEGIFFLCERRLSDISTAFGMESRDIKTIQVWRNVWYAIEHEAYMLNFVPKAELKIGLVDRLTSFAEALVSNLLDITSVNSGNVCYSYLMHISLRASSPIWVSEVSLARTRFTRPNRRACSQARCT